MATAGSGLPCARPRTIIPAPRHRDMAFGAQRQVPFMPPAQSTSGNGATGPEEPAAPPLARGFAVADSPAGSTLTTRGNALGAAPIDADTAHDDHHAPTAHMKGPVVVTMIVLTALFVVAMVAVIY